MLLLSIRPKYVDLILAGTKRVELRRQQPRMKSGEAVIYATSPRMELVASFRISSVIRAPIGMLWQLVRHEAGVSRREFDAYFAGLDAGIAIHITDVSQFHRPLPLHELRAAWKGFHPPQGFRYLNQAEITKLGIGTLRQAA